MKICKQCAIEKAAEYFYAHGETRDRLQTSCKVCMSANAKSNRSRKNETNAEWKKQNKEKVAASGVAYRQKNKEKCNALSDAWWKRHPEKQKLKNKSWESRNVEKRRLQARAWAKNNPDKINAINTRHKADKLNATPSWANHFFIKEAYRLAHLRNKTTGFKWHVDHIVPLRSKFVCGLHCEANLRVIPAIENIKKKNFYWPEMPEQLT